MASNAQESSTCELPQSSGSASRGKRNSYARANTIGWIKPRPRIQRALELTAQHLRGEINRPRANYSRKYGNIGFKSDLAQLAFCCTFFSSILFLFASEKYNSLLLFPSENVLLPYYIWFKSSAFKMFHFLAGCVC